MFFLLFCVVLAVWALIKLLTQSSTLASLKCTNIDASSPPLDGGVIRVLTHNLWLHYFVAALPVSVVVLYSLENVFSVCVGVRGQRSRCSCDWRDGQWLCRGRKGVCSLPPYLCFALSHSLCVCVSTRITRQNWRQASQSW